MTRSARSPAATRAGTAFVFGYLGGGPLPFDPKTPGADFVLAFQALPLVLVMSVLTTLLFYWRILPPIVRGFSWAAGADARRRRRGRAVDRSQHLRRHGRGAAVHPAVSGEAHAQRIVRGDDRRHGRHRRHGAGALRHDPWPARSRMRPAHFVIASVLGAPAAHRHRADHGAGNRARRRPPAILSTPPPEAASHHGRDRQGHDGRAASCC